MAKVHIGKGVDVLNVFVPVPGRVEGRGAIIDLHANEATVWALVIPGIGVI